MACIPIWHQDVLLAHGRGMKFIHDSGVQMKYDTFIALYHGTIIHYNDVIMGMIASQITSLMVVYSIVYSGADQRRHQSPASLAFVRGIHRDRWIPRTKGQ